MSGSRWRAVLLVTVLSSVRALAQGTVQDVVVHARGLEQNLQGDPADQKVAVYLPAAYAAEPTRRFPVLFFLHGFTDTSPRHGTAASIGAALETLVSQGKASPMIVVAPSGINRFLGAFYANSATNGNWEDYIVQDVVGYVDAHYRTLPERVIAGHSMGGYGALCLSFRHPDVFRAVYALSPCCTDLVGDMGPSNPAWGEVGRLTDPAQVAEALKQGKFFVGAFAAMDAALAPDAHAKVLGDAPFRQEGGTVRTDPEAYARITAAMPVHMVTPLLPKIQQLRGIFIDYGAQDNFSHIVLGAQRLSEALGQAGVSHTLEVYQGDHGNHVSERIAERLLPWAAQQVAAAER